MDFKSKYARFKKEYGHQDSRLSGVFYMGLNKRAKLPRMVNAGNCHKTFPAHNSCRKLLQGSISILP